MGAWSSGLGRFPVTEETFAGSNPAVPELLKGGSLCHPYSTEEKSGVTEKLSR